MSQAFRLAVLDDEPDIVALVQRIFAAELPVQGFTDPNALVEAVCTRALPLDLLITDVDMPGLRGPDVASLVVAAQPRTRVLLMSGFADPRVEDPRLGRWEFIAKPFRPRQLRNAVQLLLGPPQPD